MNVKTYDDDDLRSTDYREGKEPWEFVADIPGDNPDLLDNMDNYEMEARLRAAGVDWASYGENIAVGQSTPQDVMVAWMNSDGHRRNILDPGFTHLGVGVHTASAGGPWWTQNFIR